jgi:uncharacterized membrane protein YcaP (DUF421 family)
MLLADAQSVTWVQSLSDLLFQIFGGDYPPEPPNELALHQIAARAVIVYLIGLAAIRLGKSRIISRTTTLDVILGFILGSLLSRAITGHASISGTTLACAVMVFMHWAFTAIACRSHGFGVLIKGNDRLVVIDGKIVPENMRRSHISPHDLIEELRLNGVSDISDVQQAYKERNGEISVIKRKDPPQILEVAVKDGVQTLRIAIE